MGRTEGETIATTWEATLVATITIKYVNPNLDKYTQGNLHNQIYHGLIQIKIKSKEIAANYLSTDDEDVNGVEP